MDSQKSAMRMKNALSVRFGLNTPRTIKLQAIKPKKRTPACSVRISIACPAVCQREGMLDLGQLDGQREGADLYKIADA